MSNNDSKKPEAIDQYTANVLQNGISRRSFLTRAAVGTGAVAFTGLSGKWLLLQQMTPAKTQLKVQMAAQR